MTISSGSTDTIVAQATPPGNGGVGIVRVSGPESCVIADRIVGCSLKPRFATYLPFKDLEGNTLDFGLALFFQAPHSFTGEDIVEFHMHGGQVALDLLIKTICSLNARLAAPGEFSRRAFLNDKIDLAQAEAISDLINATTETAARSAIRSLSGEFSAIIHQLLEKLIYLRMYIESAIDFPDEEIDFLSDEVISSGLSELAAFYDSILSKTREGVVLNEGMRVVILGQPNAGKSSLLNALTGEATAIVTEIAGTTRDIVRETIQIDGMPLILVDTAGIRDAEDVVESEGIRRAWDQVNSADRIIVLIDAVTGITSADMSIIQKIDNPDIVSLVFNKADLNSGCLLPSELSGLYSLNISALTGEGISDLKHHLKECMGYSGGEGAILARRRHLDALVQSRSFLLQAISNLKQHMAGELAAEDLRQAQLQLNRITGNFDNEDLLDHIFSSFCIGK